MIKVVSYVNLDVRKKTSCCDIIETNTESKEKRCSPTDRGIYTAADAAADRGVYAAADRRIYAAATADKGIYTAADIGIYAAVAAAAAMLTE